MEYYHICQAILNPLDNVFITFFLLIQIIYYWGINSKKHKMDHYCLIFLWQAKPWPCNLPGNPPIYYRDHIFCIYSYRENIPETPNSKDPPNFQI
jgi:hypothetical protein